MELTLNQIAAARACGCAFFPATEIEVQRLTMQRRIFWVEGRPTMVSRDGAYYETQATLLRLIESAVAASPQPAVVETPIRSPEPKVPSHDEGALVSEPEADVLLTALTQTRAQPRTKAGPVKPGAVLAEASPSLAGSPVAQPSAQPPTVPSARVPEASGSAAEVTVAADEEALPEVMVEITGTRSHVRPVRRRAGHPKTPRWVTAGKERRGRLK